jgi:hypothetical protein
VNVSPAVGAFGNGMLKETTPGEPFVYSPTDREIPLLTPLVNVILPRLK